MKTSEILKLSQEEIFAHCGHYCETKRCLFKKSLWKYREDGFCLKDCYEFADEWIEEENFKIKFLQYAIKFHKGMIKKYKKMKEKIEINDE